MVGLRFSEVRVFLSTVFLLALTSLFIFYASPAQANRPLESAPRLIANTPLSPPAEEWLQDTWQTTYQRLPSMIQKSLPPRVYFRFAALSELHLVPRNICPTFKNSKDPVEALEKHWRNLRFSTSTNARKGPEIVFDIQWIPLFEQLSAGKDIALPCGFRSMSRLAQGVFVQELGLIYDRQAKTRLNDLELPPECSLSDKSRPLVCRQYMPLPRRALSDSIEFRRLTGYEMSFHESRNQKSSSSPLSLEFKGLESAFAVNLSLFVLDPEFQCRRPTLYDFFSRHLEAEPFKKVSCTDRFHLLLEQKTERRHLDIPKERVYRIHYLLASKGSELSSRWGHSMLLLEVCAPQRTSVGPECSQDTFHHIVIGYRGIVAGLAINYSDGLTGEYPSMLMAYPLGLIRREYNMGELRDLKGYPLSLSDFEKNRLLDLIAEAFWTYEGQYRFISQNCATELLYLLQAASEDHAFKSITPDLVTPGEVADLLRKYHLIESIRTSDSATQEVLFPSSRRYLKAADHLIREYFAPGVLKASTLERRRVYDMILKLPNLNPQQRLKVADQMAILQTNLIEQLKLELKKEEVRLLTTPLKDNSLERQRAEIERQLTAQIRVRRDEYASRPYGLPLIHEVTQRIKSDAATGGLATSIPPAQPCATSDHQTSPQLLDYVQTTTAQLRLKLDESISFYGQILEDQGLKKPKTKPSQIRMMNQPKNCET